MTFDELCQIQKDVWSTLRDASKPIIMYGTGNGADKIINQLTEKGINLSGIFASDDFARNQIFRGFTVKKYSDFCREFEDFIVIVSFASQRQEVLDNIYSIDSERELYAPDVPVFGNGLFDLDFFQKNKERLRRVYDRLSDEQSKNVFLCSIAFKLTGKICYLRQCETTIHETNKLISGFIGCNNYIDIGAYNGDTVEEYTNLYGTDMHLYAFEPDEKNFKKMLSRFEEKKIQCQAFNVAAWNENTVLRFYSNSGRAGSAVKGISSVKFKDIEARRVDSLVDDEIGFIKIDAEGTDIQVLEGLKKIITTSLPCIKVAAYHRNEDFFEIPEKVTEFSSSFLLYMRHLKYVPGWDTDFIFVFGEK